ncbi:hypothetical protein G9F71_024705 [Clostridium sp. FP2]|uniref:hypothetical protein n=1 Tax=Clostridium sp. FP2 TaxID=2724481 RepID=UPI0013E95109|nr:hypothetical protein [Clostridium sp. FP2]MBZ9626009.1 hypothetical protein [Clostridium sp. FP2]
MTTTSTKKKSSKNKTICFSTRKVSCMLKSAIDATANKRNSVNIVENYESIIQVVQHNDTMKKHWQVYQKDFSYAKDISFKDTCDAVKDIMGYGNHSCKNGPLPILCNALSFFY